MSSFKKIILTLLSLQLLLTLAQCFSYQRKNSEYGKVYKKNGRRGRSRRRHWKRQERRERRQSQEEPSYFGNKRYSMGNYYSMYENPRNQDVGYQYLDNQYSRYQDPAYLEGMASGPGIPEPTENQDNQAKESKSKAKSSDSASPKKKKKNIKSESKKRTPKIIDQLFPCSQNTTSSSNPFGFLSSLFSPSKKESVIPESCSPLGEVSKNQICTMEYMPVCTICGQKFSNMCHARGNGYLPEQVQPCREIQKFDCSQFIKSLKAGVKLVVCEQAQTQCKEEADSDK